MPKFKNTLGFVRRNIAKTSYVCLVASVFFLVGFFFASMIEEHYFLLESPQEIYLTIASDFIFLMFIGMLLFYGFIGLSFVRLALFIYKKISGN